MRFRKLLLLSFFFAALPSFAAHYLLELSGLSPAEAAITNGSRTASPRERRLVALGMRQATRNAQERSRIALKIPEARVLHRLNFLFNGFIVDLTDAEAAAYKKNPEVRAVYKLAPSHYVMNAALPLIHAPEAWAYALPESAEGAGAKIGIIDSTLDVTHPAFQDPDLPMPDGFPKGNDDDDLAKTSNKIIVYRTYDQLGPNSGGNTFYHGTGVTMVAAGAHQDTYVGPMSGVAPKAWVGFYQAGDLSNDSVLHAIDDAVADGMDVINLSIAFTSFPRPESRAPFEAAADRAYALGVALAWGAGNDGPGRYTIGSQSFSQSNLIVGGTNNSRWIGGTIAVDGLGTFPIVPIPGSTLYTDAIQGQIRDLREVDGLAGGCNRLPPGSLQGRIVIADFSTPCDGLVRIQNMIDAGAAAILGYNGSGGTPDSPDAAPFPISFPIASIADVDVDRIFEKKNANATATFVKDVQPADPTLVTALSSRGPTIDYQIRPDLLGVAAYVYVAYPGGLYAMVSGTSVATPMVAGAIALLKAARPWLSPAQLYSLVTDTAAPLSAPVMEGGAGLLNIESAMKASLTAFPRSISFGVSSTAGTGTIDQSKVLQITNIGADADQVQFSIIAADGQPVPFLNVTSLNIAAGDTANASIRFAPGTLKGGEYQGFVRVASANSGTELRIPYWFAVPVGVPASILVRNKTEYYPNATYRYSPNLPEISILDASGIPIANITPKVAIVSGNAQVFFVSSASFTPGVYQVGLKFGATPGLVVLRVQAGSITKDVTLRCVPAVNPRIDSATLLMDFGSALTGYSKDIEVPVYSEGGAPLVISGATFSDPQFKLVSPALPVSIAPGSSARFVLRFSPTGAGDVSAVMSLASNDPVLPSLPFTLKGSGAPGSGPVTLQVDGGYSDGSIGYPGGADIAYFVNRLTPPKYPAVLQSVQIFFGNRADGLKTGTPITAIARPNPGGDSSLEAFSFIQVPGTVGPLGTFSTYTFTQPVRIESGDFVVGFQANNLPSTYPADQDRTTLSQKRSYVSNNGVFRIVDIDAGIPGNFLIRAVVTFP